MNWLIRVLQHLVGRESLHDHNREEAHGVVSISPRTAARLTEASPRPLTKIYRLTGKKGLLEAVLEGDTINTPSMLCIEDALDGLRWAESASAP